EVGWRLCLAALVVGVALEVAGPVGQADGAAVGLDDAADEVEAAATPVRVLAVLRVGRALVVCLDGERVEREDERVDALELGLVVGAPGAVPAAGAAALPGGVDRRVGDDDAAACEQSEDVPAVAGGGVHGIDDVVGDDDVTGSGDGDPA